MVVNKFMCNNIMIKNKTLPLYEQGGVYNLKKRKYKNIDTLHQYNMTTQVLTKNVRCGNLWDTIKRIFKKGKDITKKVFNYVDNSPILDAVKDIGFDYIQQKTGINPNDYYNITRDVVNSDLNTNVKNVTTSAAKTLRDTYDKYKTQKTKPNNKNAPSKKEQLKTFITDFSNNLMKQIPEEKETIKHNVDLFASGIGEISAGSINLDVWKKKAPLFLVSSIATKGNGKCGNNLSDKVKAMLKNKYNILDFRLPPTMKRILEKDAKGRLYLGHGDELSTGRLHLGNGEKSGKKSNDKYAKLLAALK